MRDRKLEICVVAGLEDRLSAHAVAPEAAFAHELVSALAAYSRQCGGFGLTVVALSGSEVEAPLIGVDPGCLETATGDPFARFVVADAIYGQLAHEGALDGFTVVHWLAPVVSPLRTLAYGRGGIVRTNLWAPSHPAAHTSRALLGRRLREIRVGSDRAEPLGAIPPAVDLARFRLGPVARSKVLVALESSLAARRVAELSNHDLAILGRDPERTLGAAAALLLLEHPLPIASAVWAARALACGTPVLGWIGSGLEAYVRHGVSGALAPLGDVRAAADEVRLLAELAGTARCRKVALARNGPRGVAAKHYEVYRSSVSASK